MASSVPRWDERPKAASFPVSEAYSPTPSYVAGWTVEQYQIDLIAAAQHSRERMEQQVYHMCARQVPGDTHRNLRVQSQFSGQTFKHTLLPVWFVTYNYGSKTFQVVLNGVTGSIAGEHPKSFWKIFFLVLFIALLTGAFYLGNR